MILMALLACSPVISLVSPAFGAPADSTSSALVKQTETNIQSLESTLDTPKAVALAEASSQFQTYSKNFTASFDTIVNDWSFTQSGEVSWASVTAVFALHDASGLYAYLHVVEQPDLSSVTKAVLQLHPTASSTSTNWEGYTFTGDSYATVHVYETYAAWYLPAVSEPYSYACYFQTCALSVWTGLTDDSTGTNIAQTGTQSEVYCTIGCSYTYHAWTELWPTENEVNCANDPVSAGDSMASDVINGQETGGSWNHYDLYVYDFTTNHTCSRSVTWNNISEIYYGQFIAERPLSGGSPERLPQFSSFNMNAGQMYYNSANHYIYTPYNNGWYTAITMANGGHTNVYPSVVSTSSYFTHNYNTSSGT